MDREQYIDEHLKVIRDRQAVELKRAAQFFGEEWDKEHGDE
jgi:hypothetical protein